MDRCRENACLACLHEYFTTIVRVIGVIIAVVTWIIALNTLFTPWVAVYLIFAAIVLSVLEGLFLFESCITSCCDNDGCCGRTWVMVRFLDNWKRSILYVALSIACFFISDYWVVFLAGVFIVILAVLYVIRSFYIRRREQPATETVTMSQTQNAEFQNSGGITKAEKDRMEAESRYAGGGAPRDEEMGKGGDAGFGDVEARYPY